MSAFVGVRVSRLALILIVFSLCVCVCAGCLLSSDGFASWRRLFTSQLHVCVSSVRSALPHSVCAATASASH